MKDVLKYLRQLSNFTQDDVAKKLGVSRQTYNKYEKGTVVPGDDFVELAAVLYQVEKSFILQNKVPSVGKGKIPYSIPNVDEGFLEVADSGVTYGTSALKDDAPQVATEHKTYEGVFDGTSVRLLSSHNFKKGQLFKLVEVIPDDDDLQKRQEAMAELMSIINKRKPLDMPPDVDPYYKEMLAKARDEYYEEKYGPFN